MTTLYGSRLRVTIWNRRPAAAAAEQSRNGEACECELRGPDGQTDALWKWHEPLRFKASLTRAGLGSFSSPKRLA